MNRSKRHLLPVISIKEVGISTGNVFIMNIFIDFVTQNLPRKITALSVYEQHCVPYETDFVQPV